MTAGRSPDAPTDRAGDGHRTAVAEVLPDAIRRFYPDVQDAISAALAAERQRGRDETARKIERVKALAREAEGWPAGDRLSGIAIAGYLRRALADRTEATP